MNNRSKSHDERFGSPAHGEDQRLRDDLEEVYRLPVPSMRFNPLAAAPRMEVARHRRWRPALIGAAAAAGLAVFLAGPSLFGGSPQEVSAQEVLERTQTVAATNSPVSDALSYHMMARSESHGPPGMELATMGSTTETWYLDAEHQRTETYDEDGNLVFGQSQDGDDLWFYSSAPGEDELRVVHSSPANMGFTTFGAQDFGANSLAGLLELYSGSCAKAESLGEEVVAGRPAYVIEVTQTPETCDLKPVITQDGDLTSIKVEAKPGTGAGVAGVMVSAAGVATANEGEAGTPSVDFQIVQTTTRMWVDQETFITLKSETESEDGLLFRYEVTEFEVSPEFDASTFAYEAPEGVEVIESESPADIKIVLSGGSGVGRSFSGGSFEAAEPVAPVDKDTTER